MREAKARRKMATCYFTEQGRPGARYRPYYDLYVWVGTRRMCWVRNEMGRLLEVKGEEGGVREREMRSPGASANT